MRPPIDVQQVLGRVRHKNRPLAEGRVQSIRGIAIHVSGLRAAIGDLCTIRGAGGEELLPAEVVGFDGETAVVMPLGEPHRIAPWDTVTSDQRPLEVPVGPELLGRVVDALGNPLDGGPPPAGTPRAVVQSAPPALSRTHVLEPVTTGVAAIDGFLTCGKGQRVGIFAGSGVGKSSLLGMVARGGSAQVNVIALIGERGREVREFIDNVLGEEGMARSVVVVATSDSAPMLRTKGPFTAVSIAESFRNAGMDVLFMMDSVTRFAGAVREVGLAAGEPPTLRGFPPSLFAVLPRLVERLGNDDRGSITGMLAVLVDGDDLNEPVSDALRGYLDGHIVLNRAIASRGRYPAIDVLASVSRLMDRVTGEEHRRRARIVREWLAHYEENRDLLQVGAYRKGADALLDRAVDKMPAIEELLFHGTRVRSMEETLTGLARLVT